MELEPTPKWYKNIPMEPGIYAVTRLPTEKEKARPWRKYSVGIIVLEVAILLETLMYRKLHYIGVDMYGNDESQWLPWRKETAAIFWDKDARFADLPARPEE